MDYKKLNREIRDFLKAYEKVRYGEWVGAPWPYNHDGPMVYTEPEAVLLDQAADAIKELQARAETAEAIVDKYQTEIVPKWRRIVVNAENERDWALAKLNNMRNQSKEDNT